MAAAAQAYRSKPPSSATMSGIVAAITVWLTAARNSAATMHAIARATCRPGNGVKPSFAVTCMSFTTFRRLSSTCFVGLMGMGGPGLSCCAPVAAGGPGYPAIRPRRRWSDR